MPFVNSDTTCDFSFSLSLSFSVPALYTERALRLVTKQGLFVSATMDNNVVRFESRVWESKSGKLMRKLGKIPGYRLGALTVFVPVSLHTTPLGNPSYNTTGGPFLLTTFTTSSVPPLD